MDNVLPFLFSMSSQIFVCLLGGGGWCLLLFFGIVVFWAGFGVFCDVSLFGMLLKLCQGEEEESRTAKTRLERSQIHPYICFCFLLVL